MRGSLSKSEYYTKIVCYPLIRTGPVFGEQTSWKDKAVFAVITIAEGAAIEGVAILITAGDTYEAASEFGDRKAESLIEAFGNCLVNILSDLEEDLQVQL